MDEKEEEVEEDEDEVWFTIGFKSDWTTVIVTFFTPYETCSDANRFRSYNSDLGFITDGRGEDRFIQLTRPHVRSVFFYFLFFFYRSVLHA